MAKKIATARLSALNNAGIKWGGRHVLRTIDVPYTARGIGTGVLKVP